MSNQCETVPCDLCGSPEAREVPHSREYTKNGVPVNICKQCGFVYTPERRSTQAIADSWSNELYGDDYTARIPAVKARQVYVADTIDVELGLRGKTVCDIGGGEGQFLEIARDDYGARVFTTEASERNCFKMELAGIKNFVGTVEDYSESELAAKHQFDIVTIMWTLEACRNPREMLEAAFKITKKMGHVVVATGSRILVPFKKPLNLFFSSTRERDTHPIDFSSKTLEGFMMTAGFEPVYTNRFLDSDVLLVIGRKVDSCPSPKFPLDDPGDVAAFFERWHQETLQYPTASR